VHTKDKIKISEQLKNELQSQIHVEQQVIIHCHFHSLVGGDGIRIWPSTYLFDHHSDHVSTLAFAEGISMFPTWTWLPNGEFSFTLIFSGLPRSCKMFDLVEDCNGNSGSFKVSSIKRTKDDVYHVDL